MHKNSLQTLVVGQGQPLNAFGNITIISRNIVRAKSISFYRNLYQLCGLLWEKCDPNHTCRHTQVGKERTAAYQTSSMARDDVKGDKYLCEKQFNEMF